MTLEDPTETAEIFIKGAGEDMKAVDAGLEREAGIFGVRYIGRKDVNFEKANRINERDLKDQYPGEFHLINMDNLSRGKSFYANPPQLRELRVNSFVRVEPPKFDEISRTKETLYALNKKFNSFNETTFEKLKKSWDKKIDDEGREFISAINFEKNNDFLKQAAFAFAVRKKSIDIVDNKLVVQVKDLEDLINRKLEEQDEYTDDVDFLALEDDDLDALIESADKNLTPKELLIEEIKQNHRVIIDTIDLENNPLVNLEVEINDLNDNISTISKNVIERWKNRGMLASESLYTDLDTQDDIAHKVNQKIILDSNECKKKIEECIKEENFNNQGVKLTQEINDLVDEMSFEDIISEMEN